MAQYDIVVVGGGPVGLSAAYQAAVKRGQRVLLLERHSLANAHGSSPGYSRQFRTCYSEYHLSDLAIKTSPLWNQLMVELGDNTLLDRTGCLWFGDSSVSTAEGNIREAIQNLETLGEPYEEIEGRDAIAARFPFIAGAVSDIDADKALALYMDDGGTVNVPALVEALAAALRACPTATVLEHTNVTCVDCSDAATVSITADNGQTYTAGKVIMAPGTNANEALAALSPVFPFDINLTIYLWSSVYFEVKDSPSSDTATWPIWYFFGQERDTPGTDHADYNSYYGFPSDVKDQPGHARVAPAFTSHEDFDYHLYPPPITPGQRPLDNHALGFTSSFVRRSMVDLKFGPKPGTMSTCVAGFAELTSGDVDASAGFVLDFVPNTNNRVVLTTGGWGMKFVPVFGVILADLAIDGQTSYQDSIQPMNINRGVLQPRLPQAAAAAGGGKVQKSTGLSVAQRAKKFNKLWS